MKRLTFVFTFFSTAVIVFLSCGKGPEPPSSVNQPPVANAGADTTVTIASCSGKITVELNGSASADPDAKIAYYLWKQIPGQGSSFIRNPGSAKTKVEELSKGIYAFELTVTDEKNASSRGTVLITIIGTAKEYDLDITFTGSFKFTDNLKDCYYSICDYYDFTEINGKGIFQPFGEFTLYISETSDTAVTSYASESRIHFFTGNVNRTSLTGTSSVSLEKLFQQGGGPFNGTFIIIGGTAQQCDNNIFNNLPPLNVTGSLDTASKRATLRIKGKAYF